MNIELLGKGFVVLGLRGTGKSILVKYILSKIHAHLVYDTLREHKGFNRYIPDHRQYSQAATDELNLLVNRIVIGTKLVRLFIVEEANRFCPPKPKPLPAAMLDLNDFCRHQRIAFGCVARRPTQLHSDLVELADYIFIFRLVGKNDYQYLESLAEGLGDAARSLLKWHFVIVNPDRSFEVHEPIKYPLTLMGSDLKASYSEPEAI